VREALTSCFWRIFSSWPNKARPFVGFFAHIDT
jgi:hypothetical protein